MTHQARYYSEGDVRMSTAVVTILPLKFVTSSKGRHQNSSVASGDFTTLTLAVPDVFEPGRNEESYLTHGV